MCVWGKPCNNSRGGCGLWRKSRGKPPPREDIIVTVLRLINYALKRCVSTLYEAALYLNSMSFRLLPDIAEIFAPRLPNHHWARTGCCHCMSLPTMGNATSHDMNIIVNTQLHPYFRIANLGGSSVTEACGNYQIDREHWSNSLRRVRKPRVYKLVPEDWRPNPRIALSAINIGLSFLLSLI